MSEEQQGQQQSTEGEQAGTQETAEFAPITSQEEFDRALSKRLDRERAKFADYDDLKSQVKEFDKTRRAAMTDAERAIEEAKQSVRTEAATSYGKRLATSEIRATAADAGADLAGVFDYLDLARFVTEDGEPDEKAIKAFVGGLPKKDPGAPSFDGGTRTPPPAAQGMSGLIRKAAGRA